ncbi:hypothetical protein [Pseudomonas auratipiscis]|uniref:SAVED-fused 2TM effector domain-containing protein n=1 Tax=Pseudomonas auratipiscis TaxID=3115853 RepID=A0AB35WS72_9PSED|nr:MULTISPECIES: hypothetical protein [unclassified Pseudomonas]MEE1867001.1 hypothetical protein [Pseudomonas sp. 120P]MEE1957828.1 hypothetical protein [Pseudomonas sp. 119P]
MQANVDTTGGPATRISVIAFSIGVLMILVGIYLNLQDRKQLARQRVLILEQKGLFKIDTPLDTAVKNTVGGNVDTILVDTRQGKVPTESLAKLLQALQTAQHLVTLKSSARV